MLKCGFVITGSFCSMNDMLEVLKMVNEHYEVEVFVSDHVFEMNTRFQTAKVLIQQIEDIIDKKVKTTIQEAEIYGPLERLDIILVYPCDSHTLNKIHYGINDNAVTMIIKSSLRNQIPVVMGVFTNDALGNSGVSLMYLFNQKGFYFVPMYQDQYKKKPNSMIADKNYVLNTLKKAYNKEQIQPFMLGYKKV